MVEFKKLEPKEMNLLLEAFGIKLKDKECHFCSDSLKLESVSFLPPPQDDVNRSYILCCSSIICIAHYLEMIGD